LTALLDICTMDIVQRFSVRKPGEQEATQAAHMTTAQISAEVDAQSERLEAIRRKLFVVKCEQVGNAVPAMTCRQ
jgi:hypothetical protein